MDRLVKGFGVRVPVRATLWYMASTAIGKGVGILATAVFTRIMSGEEYGAYTVYMSWLGIAVTVSSAAASASAVYKCIGESPERREDLLATFTAAYVILSFGVWVAMSIAGLGGGMSVFVLLQCIADGTVAIYLTEKKHTYSYKTVAMIGISEAIVSPVIAYFLITGWGLGYLGRVIGYLVLPFTLAVVIAARRWVRGARPLDLGIWKRVAPTTLALLPYSIATAVSTQADKLIVSAKLGRVGIAAYSVVHTVGSARVFLTAAVGSALYPWISRKLRGGDYTEIGRILSALTTLYAVVAIYTVDAAPELISLLAPDEYAVALSAIVPLAVTALPSFLTGCITVVLMDEGGATTVSVASVASALTSIALNMLLIPRIGYMGAALSSLLSSCVMLSVMLRGIKRKGVKDALSLGKFIAVFLLALLYSALLYALYPYPVLRILLLIPPTLYAVRDGVSVYRMLLEKNT